MELEILFEDIDLDGATIGYFKDKKVKCYGVLLGEKAKVKVTKKNKDFLQAIPIEILEKSPYRIKELEDHFLSCSPLQISTYQYQLELKQKILHKIFGKDLELVPAKETLGYRTKMEFSFFIDDQINLGLFKRGTYKAKYKLPNGCILASEKINTFAINIIKNLNKKNIDPKILKGLIIRESKSEDQLIACLFIKDRNITINSSFYDEFDMEKHGISISYSNPYSPAFTFEQAIEQLGISQISQKLKNLTILYGIRSFFQNNIPMFELALEDIQKQINGSNIVLELYSGVGSIGLYLSQFVEKVLGVESNEEAVKFAKKNAILNQINNFDIINCIAEKFSYDQDFDTIIVDPPRSGLHPSVIKMILEKLPYKVIYLSCNPITQKENVRILESKYNIVFIKGYDFYPHTTHIETLVILKRK